MEEEEASSSIASSSLSSSTTSTSSSTSSSSTSATTTLSTTTKPRCGPVILPGEIRQLFSLPESIIYYIAMHPSNAEVYKKLIHTCKYFFNRNPILITDDLWLNENQKYSGKYEWKASFNRQRDEPKDKIDLDMVQCKLWITGYIDIPSRNRIDKNIAASIISKIYRCDAYALDFYDQILTFDEFLLLGSNAKYLYLFSSTITENDGKAEVIFEKIIEKLPKIEEIWWDFIMNCKCFTSSTVSELIKLPHFANINWLELNSLPENFDAKALFDYIKTRNKNMKMELSFNDPNCSDRFKQEMEEIVNEILSTKVFTYKPPSFYYPGIEQKKYKKLSEIHYRYKYL